MFPLEKIEHRAGLAPLAGYTDSAFRELCRRFGAGFTVSEMVSAEGIFHKRSKSRSLMEFTPAEQPFGIQLFGKNPAALARATAEAGRLQPDFIDLNCGCPARKVVRSGSGGALMGKPELLEAIFKSMRDATDIPLTVKIRAGLDAENRNAPDIARLAEKCGFDAVTIHPRTVTQGFGGLSDWSVIREVKEAVNIPVIGNGDVKNREDALRMLESSGCDLLMVGRAAMGRPWIFAQIAGLMESPERRTLYETVDQHYRLMLERKGEYVGVREMRKHLIWYSRGLPQAAEFRRRVVTLDNPEIVLAEIDEFFDPRRTVDKIQKIEV